MSKIIGIDLGNDKQLCGLLWKAENQLLLPTRKA